MGQLRDNAEEDLKTLCCDNGNCLRTGAVAGSF
jgi:hypothetical protein